MGLSMNFTGQTTINMCVQKNSVLTAKEWKIHEPKRKTVAQMTAASAPNTNPTQHLAIIDVTNRCNLTCPVCFANAAAAGYVYEPTAEQITGMLENLRANKPVASDCTSVLRW